MEVIFGTEFHNNIKQFPPFLERYFKLLGEYFIYCDKGKVFNSSEKPKNQEEVEKK